MILDAEMMLKICGTGSYLQIGYGQSNLVFELLKRSADAYGLDSSPQVIANSLEYAPGRFIEGTIAQYPFKTNSFDTVIVGNELLNYTTEQLPGIFTALRAMTKRNLVLYFPFGIAHPLLTQRNESNRLFWEKLAIQSGFRLHSRRMVATPYHELENEQMGRLTFFERPSDTALDDFPLTWLLENRDLHMDMLREAGRRSDGHVSRYALAATKIRPGDTVLDAACGLGYGTAVMSASSNGARFIGVDIDETSVAYAKANYAALDPKIEYHASDVANLSFLKDHSIDIVVSFETIEHVRDYDVFLTEVKRVLKPDGRFIGSVPNLWCDETGHDPNPFHFHVFDWKKLNDLISKYFIVEERWAQTAGGGFKLWDRKREMHNIPLTSNASIETEWWIISASAEPINSAKLSYTNPFRQHNTEIPTLIDFGKYYDNPWLYRTMVQLGERIANRDILSFFCAHISNSAKPGSADQGAAICVLAYQVLETGQINTNDMNIVISSINKYDEHYDRENPHAWRWAVSLHYVGARLLLLSGNREAALTTFLTCAEMDALKFSPLLATKIISSRMYAGLIYVGNGNYSEARKQFILGVKEAHRVLQGDWKNIVGDFENPLPFSLQEVAEVADLASQCVQALHAIDRGDSPGYLWDRINLRRFGIVEWTKSVERENERLRMHQQSSRLTTA